MTKPGHMPILDLPAKGAPRSWGSVPFNLFAPEYVRRRAQANHGQTPERLAERGGVSAPEAICLLGDLPLRRARRFAPDAVALARLEELVTPRPGFRRAGGQVVCKECGHEYYEHPRCPHERNAEGRPFLRVACGGERLKL